MFNIAYPTGILVILVPWNSIFIGFLATGFSFPIQQICMGGLSHSSRFTNAPLVIGMTFLALGIIYVVIIRSAGNRHVKRGETHKYLLVNVRFLYIMSNSPFYPFMKTTFPAYHILSYIIIYLSLILIFVIKNSRRTWKYLDKLSDDNLKNLPANNLLTFRDTRLVLGKETNLEKNISFTTIPNPNTVKIFQYFSTLYSSLSDNIGLLVGHFLE